MSGTFRALFVGADHYFPNRFGSASYRSLGACVRDVTLMEAVVRGRIPGPQDITRLIAPAGEGVPGSEAPPETWPTAANLRAALAGLVARTQRGDEVLIYYAGHGGRVLTSLPAVKGPAGVDEALVPIDIGSDHTGWKSVGTDPSRYLRDHELARVLADLDERGARVTLVLDCCHAGGATRDALDIGLRCATGGDTLDRTPMTPLPVPEQRAREASWTRLTRTEVTRSVTRVAGLPDSDAYVLLAACKATESALEVTQEGGRIGVLTDALRQALAEVEGPERWQTLYERVFARVHSQYPSQTPQLLGDVHRAVLGGALSPIPRRVTVRTVIDANTVLLGAGASTGVTAGASFALFPVGLEDLSDDRQVGVATVTSADAATARATLEAGSDVSKVGPGSPAVALALAVQRSVALRLPDALAGAARQALASARSALLVLWRGDETPAYVVCRDDDGRLVIQDGMGKARPYVPPIPETAPRALETLAGYLHRLARYDLAMALQAPHAAEANKVEVELLRAPPGLAKDAAQATLNTAGTALSLCGDACVVEPGTVLLVRVTNTGDKAVNVVVLDLQCDHAIVQLGPDRRRGAYQEIGPREVYTFPVRMYLSEGWASADDVLKVFVLPEHVEFDWLLQGPLEPSSLRSRQPMRRGPRNALEALFNALDASPSPVVRMRRAKPRFAPGAWWATRSFRVRVARSL